MKGGALGDKPKGLEAVKPRGREEGTMWGDETTGEVGKEMGEGARRGEGFKEEGFMRGDGDPLTDDKSDGCRDNGDGCESLSGLCSSGERCCCCCLLKCDSKEPGSAKPISWLA